MKSLFLTLTPAKMRQKLLDEAQRDLVETAKNREYYVAIEAMLKQRIERLRDEIHADNQAPAAPITKELHGQDFVAYQVSSKRSSPPA